MLLLVYSGAETDAKKLVAAAAATADDDGPPPPELTLGWYCEKWKALPGAGGVLDQEYQVMRRITAMLNIYDAVTRLRGMRGAQIHGLTDNERVIIRYLLDNGMLNG